jgi:hypothetical protein
VHIAAKIINVVFLLIFLIIVLGIFLYVLGANQDNAVVGWIVGTAAWLAGPFRNLFLLDNNNVQVALNWGLAALVYLIVGIVLVRMVERTVDRRVGAGQ